VAKRYKVILMRYLPLLLLMLAAVPAQATEWRMQSGSEFTFEATFESVASPGRFAEFDVVLEFDAADPGAGRLRVTVNLAAADMGDADMNAIIADPIWFDVGNFPQAVYESEQIEARAPGEFVATGVLNLKGISKTVTVPFSWSEQDARANMRGQFVLQRIDFKVGSGEWATGDAIGLDVKLQFDLSLERGD
jgi:polyisoprenoid-binding protein YceI